MNRPVSYLQTDPRWKNIPYAVPGESATIGGSGCGPSSMAMVLATWIDPKITPLTECNWAQSHGFKAKGYGTYYGYFEASGKNHGLKVDRLNWKSIYGLRNSPYHDMAKKAVQNGDLVIACMGPGTWTRGGHFVLVYGISGNTIYINDPASIRKERTEGNYKTFTNEVKYYFVIRKPVEPDKPVKNDSEYQIMKKAMEYASSLPESEWSKDLGYWKKATESGIVDGSGPERPCTRAEAVAMLYRMMNEEE